MDASMSEPRDNAAAAIGVDHMAGSTAGAMLRGAREKRGLHIAALAAAIKVPQRKLEALENDRYEELLDLTFTRALAQTVCRSLKIDAQPVLDRLPQPEGASPKLQHVSNGLNAPFRDKPGREEPADWGWLRKPAFWGTLLVLIAAALVNWMPARFLDRLRSTAPAAPGASAAASSAVSVLPPSATSATGTTVVETVPVVPIVGQSTAAATPLGAPAPEAATASAAAAASVPMGSALLGLKVNSESWVEVQDARGQTLVSRRVAAGEAFGLNGEVPLRLTIGNAAATQVTFRGKPVDISGNTVANVARLQLN
jgi:cytoskeleton protein RodZ